MKLTIDTRAQTLEIDDDDGARQLLNLYSAEAFDALSRQWLRVGWTQKYSYQFSWLGRPVVQLPEDLLKIQELVYSLAPEVIVESGVAHGGSLIFFASICNAIGKGRVIGVDVSIRPANRAAIDEHALSSYISLVEGSSIEPSVVQRVRQLVGEAESVMVVLDSNHSRDHVAAELRAYAPMVTPGGYLIVEDGIMRDLADVPGGRAAWREDNPAAAVADFLRAHDEFSIERPSSLFTESTTTQPLTYWPDGWLRKRSPRAE
ncbi:MAG: class I SAM-dependent methyltransferase [Chloroflexi bacterium]|nr:class I SAM-dependent methyltransferase [Chloroflexota bacterium]MBV9894112.1 class I SAM-dependent methyltransferase [Chloroflexota bacterium]